MTDHDDVDVFEVLGRQRRGQRDVDLMLPEPASVALQAQVIDRDLGENGRGDAVVVNRPVADRRRVVGYARERLR